MYHGSTPSMASSADLFSMPPTDVSSISSNYITITPSYNFKEPNNPLQFIIPPSSSQYIDLKSTVLYVKAKITATDGTSLTDTDVLAPSNMFFYSMFKDCTVAINGAAVFRSNNWYPYIAGIPCILLNGRGAKESELTSILFYKDTAPDNFDPAANSGFKARQELSKGSKLFDMVGHLPINLLQQEKLLPTSCGVTIDLTRNASQFCVDCSTVSKTYSVVIEWAELRVRMVTMNPEVVAKHAKAFQQGKSQYPLRDVKVKTSSIPSGTQSYLSDYLIIGKLPSTIVIGLVDGLAMTGSYNKSLYNFQPFGLTSVTVSCDNNPALSRTIEVDFKNSNYLTGYNSLFKALGRRNEGNSISRDEYIKGNVLYLFDLQTAIGSEFHLANTGQIKVRKHYFQVSMQVMIHIII